MAAAKTATTPRRTPVRTCVACRTSGGKRGLLRIVRLAMPKNEEGTADATPKPGLALDPSGKKSGRGAYICPTPACVETALKRKAVERSLKAPVPDALAVELRAYVAVQADDALASQTGN